MTVKKSKNRKLQKRKKPVFLIVFLVILVFFAFEFPFNRLYNENKSLASLEITQSQLQKSNQQLKQQINQLNTPGEVDKLARERYGLVKKGEQPYVILPRNSSANPIPPIPSYIGSNGSNSTSQDHKSNQSFLKRLLSRLEFWK
jgi:cell division protein FtsB